MATNSQAGAQPSQSSDPATTVAAVNDQAPTENRVGWGQLVSTPATVPDAASATRATPPRPSGETETVSSGASSRIGTQTSTAALRGSTGSAVLTGPP